MQITKNNVVQNIEIIKDAEQTIALLRREISKTVVGNQLTIETVLIAILCNGHLLLEGVPGVAKTTLVKAIADSLDLSFKRIQFTPDLLPGDVLGSLIYNQKTQEFETKKGPIFANIVLADEINRAPAKVQSALLEAMQEQQVTLGNDSYFLPKPFFVFATQNPIEQEGTYQLPEAQLDRFMFKIQIDYPNKNEEREILFRNNNKPIRQAVIDPTRLLGLQQAVNDIYIDEKVIDYIIEIVQATRKNKSAQNINELLAAGASPRASLAIYQASRACALLNGRYFVTPDDVKQVAVPALRHRLTLSYAAQIDNINADQIIQLILDGIKTP